MPPSNWSAEQEVALKAVRRWLKEGDQQVFRLFGYAGTGKTELAHEIGAHVNKVAYAAVTGKAADVMRQRGCQAATTLHSLIYHTTFDDERKRFYTELKRPHELSGIDLIVVDEGSMVNEQLALDLLSFERQILIIADPFQLPPPDGSGAGYFMHDRPDAMLTEIHRQSRGNPILRLADRIRRGDSLPRPGYRAGDALRVVNDEDDHLNSHDVVLCGTNETRRIRNNRLRHLRGFVPRRGSRVEPQRGETLVCLRNDFWVSDPVLNGTQWVVVEKGQVGDRKQLPILRLQLSSIYDGDSEVEVPLECFLEHRFEFYPRLQMFDFGYALTVHKAQGSEWGSEMLINEAESFRAQARRWLYTGITRARERLTVVDYS